MQKEILRETTSSLCVNVVANGVESLRKVVNSTSTVRVYEDGYIGIAGQIGECDIAELEKEAIANLDNKVPYPCDLTAGVVKHVDERKDILDEDSFVKLCQSLLKKLTVACPDFLFSNKIKYDVKEKHYENSAGTSLSYKANSMTFGLVLKHKATANIMDMVYGDEVDGYDEDKVVEGVKTMCDTFNRTADIEDGKYKVISDGTVIYRLLQHVVGESYANQASIFKGKLGEKILSEKLSLFRGKAITSPFFDAEGTVVDDSAYVVRNGVFEKVLANKKISAQYSLPRIPSSGAAYDSAPTLSYSGLQIENNAPSVLDLIGNDKAILLVEASGGDMTSTGDFATPVQMSFLVENGVLVGKLPPLNLTGNINDFLGADYVGTSQVGFFHTENVQYSVSEMQITKI